MEEGPKKTAVLVTNVIRKISLECIQAEDRASIKDLRLKIQDSLTKTPAWVTKEVTKNSLEYIQVEDRTSTQDLKLTMEEDLKNIDWIEKTWKGVIMIESEDTTLTISFRNVI